MEGNKNLTEKEEVPFIVEADEKKSSSLQFGWGKFRPECLQILNGPKSFLCVLILVTLCQGKLRCMTMLGNSFALSWFFGASGYTIHYYIIYTICQYNLQKDDRIKLLYAYRIVQSSPKGPIIRL